MEFLLDLKYILPEIVLLLGALFIIVMDIAYPRIGKIWLGLTGYMFIILSFLSLIMFSETGGPGLIFRDTYAIDGFSIFCKALLLIAGSIVMLLSLTYVYRGMEYKTEFYALIMFTLMGMLVLVSATDLILIILAFETISIGSYILVAYKKDDMKSREAGLKYFFYGAISAAVLLMGFSFIYGITGETKIYDIALSLTIGKILIPDYKWIAFLALGLVGAGFGFKIAMVPFQMWVPDVYEGAPTPVTAFLSVASKSAGIAILLRFFFVIFRVEDFPVNWAYLFFIISIFTMLTGNLMAISQKNIKRMLGYSSIAHVGYMLAGITALYYYAGGPEGIDVSPILIYLMAYTYMNLGAFAVVILSEDMTEDIISEYAGMAQKAPGFSAMLAIFLLSLTGLPPLAGFIGKIFVFGEIINASLYILAIIAVINSVLSAYYYLRVIHFMYFVSPREKEEKERSYSILALTGLYICFAGTLFMGMFPNWIIELARKALILN